MSPEARQLARDLAGRALRRGGADDVDVAQRLLDLLNLYDAPPAAPWSEPAEPPPNAYRFRLLLDVSPPLDKDGNRVGYVFDEARGGPKVLPGWRRSVAVLDAPWPVPDVEIVGVVVPS